jgi:hypothetical protein
MRISAGAGFAAAAAYCRRGLKTEHLSRVEN